MSGSVNKVKKVFFPIFSAVWKTDSLAFDCNAAFPFNVHGVKELILKLTICHHITDLNKTIGKSGFAVVNMGNDAEITDVIKLHR